MVAKKHAHKKRVKDAHKIGPKEQFIIDLYPAARQVAAKTGMSWELILAQSAQETGWGQKVLAGSNNIFNIKASPDWKGATRMYNVPENENGKVVHVDALFRIYGSYEEGLEDRTAFLQDNARYRAAGLFNDGTKGDIKKEAEALQKGHYATDPHYAKHIVGVFEGPTMQRAVKEAQAREAAKAAVAAQSAQPSQTQSPSSP